MIFTDFLGDYQSDVAINAYEKCIAKLEKEKIILNEQTKKCGYTQAYL